MKFLILLLLFFTIKGYSQCPNNIEPINNNNDTFKIDWFNNKPTCTNTLKIVIVKINTVIIDTVSLFSNDTLFIPSVKINDESNWEVKQVMCGNKLVAYCNTPLPVEFGYFKVYIKYNRVYLRWLTLSEHNNNYFIIQKKVQNEFINLDTVQGHINKNTPTSYNYIDTNLQKNNIYRLLQVDLDGTKTYSPIVSINKEYTEYYYRNILYQNETLKIFSKDKIGLLYILDIRGTLVYAANIKDSYYEINLELEKGVYILYFNENFSKLLIK